MLSNLRKGNIGMANMHIIIGTSSSFNALHLLVSEITVLRLRLFINNYNNDYICASCTHTDDWLQYQ